MNGDYFSKRGNANILEDTQAFMEAGGICTMFARHGDAVQFLGLATGLPIGKITKFWFDYSDEWYKYEAVFPDTERAREVKTLLEANVMEPSSIRMQPQGLEIVQTRLESDEEEEEPLWVPEIYRGIIKGIDFCDNPGIAGAGVTRILEETGYHVVAEGDNVMDWEKVTLQDLEENVLPLLQEYASSAVEAALEAAASESEAEDDADAELEQKLAEAIEEVETLSIQVDALGVQRDILEASLTGVSRKVYDQLTAEYTGEGDLPQIAAKVRMEKLNEYLTGARQIKQGEAIKPKGRTAADGTNGASQLEAKDKLEESLSDLQRAVLHLAGV